MSDKTSNSENNINDAEMTPPEQENKSENRRWWRHLAGISATFVIVAAVFIMLPVTPNPTPKDALRMAWTALQKNDVQAFRQSVDTDSFVQSMIEQAVVYEETRRGDGRASAEDVRRVMRTGVIGAFRHDLAKTYSQQILSLVQTGQLPHDKGHGLMAKLWAETGAQKESFAGLQVVDQHERHALARMIFKRDDLVGKKLNLNLLLERSPQGSHTTGQQGWAITGLPNLADFLLDVENTREDILAKINAPIKAELAKAISFMDVQKSAGLDENNPGVLWRLAYLNNSGEDITSFTLRLAIYNAEDALLHTATFRETDPLPAGAAAEKAWPMPLSPDDKKQRQVISNDLRNLRLEMTITEATFADGRTLALYDELPEEDKQQDVR